MESPLRAALERIAGAGRGVPELECQERSAGGLCGNSAEFVVAIPGLGHAVVCDSCRLNYPSVRVRLLEPDRDAAYIVGNLRDQARNALDSVTSEV